jgi:hypothetical protein
MEFLDNLAISKEEREKLAGFGADTPYKLLNLRKASKQAFDSYIGPERAEVIAAELEKLISEDERELLKAPPHRPGSLGARLGKSPLDKS